MTAQGVISRYNYDAFVPEKFEPWLNFEASPYLGSRAPDFPLWHLDGTEMNLSDIWSEHLYTIIAPRTTPGKRVRKHPPVSGEPDPLRLHLDHGLGDAGQRAEITGAHRL